MDINTVIHKFISTDRLHRTLIEKQVAKGSLHRTQHRLLFHIFKSEEPLSQKELAAFFEVSPAAIAVSVKKLEKGGYIKREALKDDMRFNEITVTDKGKDILFKTNVVKIPLFFLEASVSLSLDKMSFFGEHMTRKRFSVTSNHVILKISISN